MSNLLNLHSICKIIENIGCGHSHPSMENKVIPWIPLEKLFGSVCDIFFYKVQLLSWKIDKSKKKNLYTLYAMKKKWIKINRTK